ncbi:hypothetical protein BJ322DRAFT_1025455 [Thelephora terrestris]|uniref:Transmembrane protein n=1 Tax=Thelephora terrestris TaxID=56493 RepID=A0A9P6H276_9AGAM|nr:hypothetical protein BJ322DRAFT_1025455 [Thelephora terrestris]
MKSRVRSLVCQFLVVFVTLVPTGWAATASCAPGWEWANNSLAQNPCQVAGYLQAPCLGYSVYELEPLKPGSMYTEPGKNDTKGLRCGCNTVIYSLYSACDACQNATVKSWGEWNQNCDAVYVAQYPFNIPSDTAIPRWAFIDFTESGNFNASAAQGVGRDPEAFGNVPVTLNLSSTSSSGKLPTSPTSTRPSSTNSLGPSGSTSTNVNGINGATSDQDNVPAIVGGVVGGVVCLACFSLLLFWLHLRRRSGGAPSYAADRALSHRTLSTRSRGSYYPPSVPIHGHEFETNKTGWHIPEVIPEVYSRPAVPPQESLYGQTEFDVQTTYNSPLYRSGRERSAGLAF